MVPVSLESTELISFPEIPITTTIFSNLIFCPSCAKSEFELNEEIISHHHLCSRFAEKCGLPKCIRFQPTNFLQAQQHKIKHDVFAKQFCCHLCNQLFITPRERNIHQASQHNLTISICSVCTFPCISYNEMKSTCSSHHQIRNQFPMIVNFSVLSMALQKLSPITPPAIEAPQEEIPQQRMEQPSCSTKYCDKCKEYKPIKNFKRHWDCCLIDLVCDICGKVCTSVSGLKNHKAVHKFSPSTSSQLKRKGIHPTFIDSCICTF